MFSLLTGRWRYLSFGLSPAIFLAVSLFLVILFIVHVLFIEGAFISFGTGTHQRLITGDLSPALGTSNLRLVIFACLDGSLRHDLALMIVGHVVEVVELAALVDHLSELALHGGGLSDVVLEELVVDVAHIFLALGVRHIWRLYQLVFEQVPVDVLEPGVRLELGYALFPAADAFFGLFLEQVLEQV